MIDSFYTSPELASRLLKYIKKGSYINVVDFCIGDGELIRAAVNIWPKIKCFGSDISGKAIKKVKYKHPNWKIGKCDFTNELSRKRCKILKNKKRGFDLVLLNPPFSCKGGKTHEINLCNQNFKVSTSMKFLSESIKYISDKGCLLAIMPISICYSQKDRKFLDYLIENYHFNVLEIPNGKFFKNCSPSIVLISLNIKKNNKQINNQNISLGFSNIEIYRGKISVFKAKYHNKGIEFIHSTNLKENKIIDVSKKVKTKSSIIKGPAILIPRVGKPSKSKICLLQSEKKYALSDCVLAIKFKNKTNINKLYKKMISNVVYFNNLYIGTGAKYITIERLRNFIM